MKRITKFLTGLSTTAAATGGSIFAYKSSFGNVDTSESIIDYFENFQNKDLLKKYRESNQALAEQEFENINRKCNSFREIMSAKEIRNFKGYWYCSRGDNFQNRAKNSNIDIVDFSVEKIEELEVSKKEKYDKAKIFLEAYKDKDLINFCKEVSNQSSDDEKLWSYYVSFCSKNIKFQDLA